MSNFTTILISSIGFGAGAEAVRRYRAFKARRRDTPREVRNAGFWTDSRIYHAELVFASIALAPPFSMIILLVSADRPAWVWPLVLLTYPAAIYLLMRSFNLPERQ